MSILSVENLTLEFRKKRQVTAAVHDLSFAVARGETLAIVGESGCGKSLTALSLLGLLPPGGHVAAGHIRLEGRDLVGLPEPQLRDIRGRRIAMIFQEPMTALNPVLTIGEQIVEAIREHEAVSLDVARRRALALLDRVRIPDAARRFADYPHRLSGGMRQRVMIAIALACSPAVLVADEPTTALDVTIQAQILGLIDELKRDSGTAVVLITHDLGVVAEHADRVLVMYAGRKVEEGRTAALLANPLHPYTRGLMAARPDPERFAHGRRDRLTEIFGMVPPLWDMPPGCSFAPRCAYATEACALGQPPLLPYGSDRLVACIRTGDVRASERIPHPAAAG